MRFVVTETLDAPQQAVFDVISDPSRRTEWQNSLVSVHVTTEGPPRLGTAWHEFARGGLRFDLEITEFDRPRRWAESARGRIADARLAVILEAPGGAELPAGSTRVIVYVEVAFKWPLGLAAPLVSVLMPAALRADLRRVEGLARALAPAA